MLLDALAASVAGSILCLDRICLQIMISRPVVAGMIIGLILKDPYTGLITGSMVELLWIDRSQIGASIPPNDSLAAVTITACTILSVRVFGSAPKELMALAVLLFIPTAFLGRRLDIMVMQANETLSRDAIDDARKGNAGGVSRRHLLGLARTLLLYLLFLAGSILIATEILMLIYPRVPPAIMMPLRILYDFILMLGIAVAINTVNLRGAVPVFCGVFLISAVLFGFP